MERSMGQNISIYFFIILFVSCGSGSQQDKGDVTYWGYERTEEASKSEPVKRMVFGDLENTLEIISTKDSTVIGTWKSHMRTTALISKEGQFFFYDWRLNSMEDSVLSISKSPCLYETGVRQGKTILNRTCGEYNLWYGAISSDDSSWVEFLVENDSLDKMYKKISHPMQPIWEKQALYKLYKERDTLSVGWYINEEGFVDKRLIGKNGQIYIMSVSEWGYHVLKTFPSPHPLGTRLDIKPWNAITELAFVSAKPYHVLSKDSSKLYNYETTDSIEEATISERVTREKYDNWIDEHLFGEAGNGEPWR